MKNWRINLILIFLFLFGAAILAKLFFIQIRQHEYWRALAQGQQKFFIETEGDRGEIFLKDSKNENELVPLVINKDWEFVYISPQEILARNENVSEVAKTLSEISKIDEKVILEKIQSQDTLYQLLKNKLSPEEVGLLKKINLPGVYLKTEKVRYYPREEFASQVLGFFGGEKSGQYGVEGYYNEILQGQKGFQKGQKNALGYLISFSQNEELTKGADLILTLDYNIQFMAEKLLEKAKEELGITTGTILVLEPNSGKIIAMANYPSFNPNDYSKQDNLAIFQNEAVQKAFEPGSIFKPITMASALNEGKITPQTTYNDEGSVKIGGHIISNYQNRSWGKATMTEVLEKSINSGAIFAEQQLGNENFLSYINRFGLFEPTGIDLQGEIFSQNTDFKKGYEVNFATASFGQGLEVTSIQLVRALSAIANGGKLIKPYLVEKIIEDGKIIETQPEIQNGAVISLKTASQVVAMMVGVVENGFGKTAKIPGYYIAGKTGTAQVPWSTLGIKKTGYSPMTIQSFIGFFPAFNPQFLILVKLDNTKTETARYSAAPIFKELAEYIINYKQIPPDYTP